MTEKIKNRQELLSYGDIESKRIVLDITEATLQELDAYKRIKDIMSLEGDTLFIGTREWDLSKKKNVYLIGAGKACNAMAKAVDEILGERLTAGIAIVKIKEDRDTFNKTEVFVGGHPIPNEDGLKACLKVLEIVDHANSDDLFIAVMSGGSSALMSCPVHGISLADEILTTDIMLKSGAGILEINAIRRHISQMNGGNLAKRIQMRGAELIGFSIYDIVGFPATECAEEPYNDFTGTPIGADQTTLEDARRVIHDYDVEDRLPKSVISYLNNCGNDGETPKTFPDFTYFVLNSVPDSCIYAKKIAREMGIPAIILTSFLEGESKDAGTIFGGIAREIQENGNPIMPPCIILSSGESTTKILDSKEIMGHGGPSQEMTASFAITAAKTDGACILSIDTEGSDGTTMLAGGITDSKTYNLACERNIDFYAALRGHATCEALTALGAGVVTGNTGTNVCDFNIMYVPEKK
jgi:glycerate-2-kinase